MSHIDLEKYEHKGTRAVDVYNITNNTENQLGTVITESGTSGSQIEFNSELRMSDDSMIWNDKLTGSSSNSYMMAKNGVEMISNNGKSVRQSYQSINLHGSRRIIATLTGIAKVQSLELGNAFFKMGIFEDTTDKVVGAAGSGVYVEYDYFNLVWNIVLFSNFSGTEQTTTVKLGQWNVDNLDGAGASGLNINLDPEKIQTFRFEIAPNRGNYVTIYYLYNGKQLPIHQFQLNQEEKFILTDNLPIRYEMSTSEVSNHSCIQMGSNVISYGGRGIYSKVGSAFIETPNEVSTSGGNEFYFMGLKNVDDVRLNTKINRLFFDAQGSTPYQYFWKLYLRRNPAIFIGNTYSAIHETGVCYSLGHDAVEYANLLADPDKFIIASGIWDRSTQFDPFIDDNEFTLGYGINGYSDELILTVRRTDSTDNKDVWGGVEILQSC